jgi:AcrR family transcriptional regulator
MTRLAAPVQDRSRRTRKRILNAAASFIARDGYHGASVRDICARARATTGAFYAHFAGKDDVALALFDLLAPEFEAAVDASLAARREQDLDAAVSILLERSIELYRRRGGLLRALMAQARTHSELAAAMRQLNGRLLRRFTHEPTGNSDPARQTAIEFALFCVLACAKEIVLDRQLIDKSLPFDDSALVRELSRLFSSYVAQREAPAVGD